MDHPKGLLFLNPADPGAAALVLHVTGTRDAHPIDGYILGMLIDKHYTWPPAETAALMGPVGLALPAPMMPAPTVSLGVSPSPAPQPFWSGTTGAVHSSPPSPSRP